MRPFVLAVAFAGLVAGGAAIAQSPAGNTTTPSAMSQERSQPGVSPGQDGARDTDAMRRDDTYAAYGERG
jgi:hypothetical protein